MSYIDLVIEAIYNNPKSLINIKDDKIISLIDKHLPYSVGFEIECDYGTDYNKRNFEIIPNIMEVRNDSSEQRYRVPSGLIGLICIDDICTQLKLNSSMNLDSGIHYHIDCSKYWEIINNHDYLQANREWILQELDTWEYKGKYNHRQVATCGHNWVRCNSEFKTLEFRCGEMSFDYSHLIKRIISASNIVTQLGINGNKKDMLLNRLSFLDSEINSLKADNKIDTSVQLDQMNKVIKKRVIKI